MHLSATGGAFIRHNFDYDDSEFTFFEKLCDVTGGAAHSSSRALLLLIFSKFNSFRFSAFVVFPLSLG